MDTSHVLADALTHREAFYVATTRGRYSNTAYLVLDPARAVRRIADHPIDGPGDWDSWTTEQVVQAISSHSAADTSAHEAIRAEQDRVRSIRQLADEADTIASYDHEIAATELLLAVLGNKTATRSLKDSDDSPELELG